MARTSGTLGPKRVLTEVTASGIYGLGEVHRERIAGNFLNGILVDYLVVASGGGGGYSWNVYSRHPGGGGGAGGMKSSTNLACAFGVPITVTVGAGGTQPLGHGSSPSGNASSFLSISTTGGGGGAYGPGYNGGNGGSGGGNGGNDAAAGTGIYGEGNNGWRSTNIHEQVRGGGGGKGAAATDGVGGSGASNSYSGSAVTYATGGASGAVASSGSGNAGGNNTGDGGQGAGGNVDGLIGSTGGSGIVIIRYADSNALAASSTGSPTLSTAGGYHVYKFTGSGSITF